MIAALVLLAIVGGWEAYVQLSGIDEFILPAPSAIAAAIHDDAGLLWSNFAVTAGEIALGIAAALALGLGCAVAIHFSATLRRALYPLLVGSQTVPIPLIAPLLVVWFGFGLTPKIAIVALVCFFPPLEIYVPAAKRCWGYYVLPILRRERIVARADAAVDREAGVLHVNALYREPGVKRTPALERAIADALQRLAAWRGVGLAPEGPGLLDLP